MAVHSPVFTKIIICVISIAVTLGLYIIINFLTIRTKNNEPPINEHADAIVVLGAAVWPRERPSPVLSDRLLRAANLYNAGVAKKIICTGGIGQNPPSEAEVGRKFLVEQGVPFQDILLEDDSYSTRDQAERIKEIYREHGWRSVALTTSFFHAKRAIQIFREDGFQEVIDTHCQHQRYIDLNHWILRESIALAAMNWWHWLLPGLLLAMVMIKIIMRKS